MSDGWHGWTSSLLVRRCKQITQCRLRRFGQKVKDRTPQDPVDMAVGGYIFALAPKDGLHELTYVSGHLVSERCLLEYWPFGITSQPSRRLLACRSARFTVFLAATREEDLVGHFSLCRLVVVGRVSGYSLQLYVVQQKDRCVLCLRGSSDFKAESALFCTGKKCNFNVEVGSLVQGLLTPEVRSYLLLRRSSRCNERDT